MAASVNVVTVVVEIAVFSAAFASIVLISVIGEFVRVISPTVVLLISEFSKADVFECLAIVKGRCVEPVAMVKSSLGVVDAGDIGVVDRVGTGVAGTNVVELKPVVVSIICVVFDVKFLLP